MSRKQVQENLESDPLLETFSKAQNFYDQRKSTVIGAIVAVIVIVGGGIGYYYYASAQAEEAQQLMSDATIAYLNSDYERALSGSDADFTVGFQQIINNYPRTDAANLARYYAAVCEYNLGNVQQAISYMEEYDIPDGILGVGPISFHAVVTTDAGNYEKAAELYVKAAEWDENDSTTPYNYLEAAQVYHDAGNTEAAEKYARIVVDQYGDSNHAGEAEKLLGMLAVSN